MKISIGRTLARLAGYGIAYDTTERVAQELAAQADRLFTRHRPHHFRGARRLSDALSFQPGLLGVRGDVLDIALYLESCVDAAQRVPEGAAFQERLGEAVEHAHELVFLLAQAAHATVPAAEAEPTAADLH